MMMATPDTYTEQPWANPEHDVLGDIQAATKPYEIPTKTEEQESDGVAIVSGGLDSITTVYYLVKKLGLHPHMVSFNYGQRHKRELDFALWNAEDLGLRWSLIDLTSLTSLIGNSALTHGADVPEGHYAEDNMAITVVPNRNMTMISIATAIAVNYEYTYVAAGMHAGDRAQYPDCRHEFMSSVWQTLMLANEGFISRDFDLLVPFIDKSKNDIAKRAYELGVRPDMTYSCYKGDFIHCGRCATCVERLEAIDSVGDPAWDKTLYADRKYWRTVVSEWNASH
jgi:7-cyano-7-deazaguanine synthase